MIIKGSLKEYPISLLLEIFKYRSETGLLEISSSSNSGQLYFKDGKLVDAVLNNAAGAEALRSVESLTDGSFEFNSVAPAEYARLVWQSFLKRKPVTDRSRGLRSIFSAWLRDWSAKAASSSRSFRCNLTSTSQALLSWANITFERQKRAKRTFVIAFEKRMTERFQALWRWTIKTASTLTADLKPHRGLSLSRAKEQLNLLMTHLNVGFSTLVLIAVAALATTFIVKGRWFIPRTGQNQITDATRATATFDTVSTADAVAGIKQSAEATNKPQTSYSGATKKPESHTSNTSARNANLRSLKPASRSESVSLAPAAGSTGSAQAEQTISVLVRIEGGRVSDASVLEPRAGLERYEAAALRIARQRRYTVSTKPFEVVTVKIKKP
jgi:hypothetical protein